jgi:hypothetical protein
VKRPQIPVALLFAALACAAPSALLWRDTGPVETLDLAAGPGGRAAAPVAPFRFVSEESRGTAPKIVVQDAKGKKWMVKFGEEAKPETFASRIAWAAGYVVRPSWYLANGRIEEVGTLHRAGAFVDAGGAFRDARFQAFDGEGFREIPGSKFDLEERREDPRELNGLKLTLLLVANWDVKPANTGVFDVAGQRYAAVVDWGASMGDPAATDSANRKWSCEAYSARTKTLLDGIDNGYVQFNYSQYASRHEHALSSGIRVEDLKWFVGRMSKLTDRQVRAALLASGAAAGEADCFTRAFRERLNLFATAAHSLKPEVMRSRKVTTTTTTK